MRKEIVDYIKDRLTETGKYKEVCGLGSKTPEYPLARVWAPGCAEPNPDNRPEARIDLRIAVQIETILREDKNGNSVDGGLYDLVDAAFAALQNLKLPGKGSQPLIVYDSPGLGEYKTDGPAVYTLQVSIRVILPVFSLI